MSSAVRVRRVPALAERDRVAIDLRRCWRDVSNAGGAVGFPFPPVSDEEMGDAIRRLVADVDADAVALFVAECDGELVGWVILRFNRSELTRHWAVVERLQARPERRNGGVGRQLVAAVVEHAKTSGLEQLRLVLRGGEGLEDFYSQLGWTEIGRHPAALRLADDDDRDEVAMQFTVSPDLSASPD